ncbi:translation initiation factor IF-2-like [Pteropus medius]|uniref:translation initiation factor IF-2-like n=1 Tax=Pteropus vampyrus TaxID=132908 RepID=UPI00196A6317|nr:translation initiation factor IF-2-like [Pteropus giganteus]
MSTDHLFHLGSSASRISTNLTLFLFHSRTGGQGSATRSIDSLHAGPSPYSTAAPPLLTLGFSDSSAGLGRQGPGPARLPPPPAFEVGSSASCGRRRKPRPSRSPAGRAAAARGRPCPPESPSPGTASAPAPGRGPARCAESLGRQKAFPAAGPSPPRPAGPTRPASSVQPSSLPSEGAMTLSRDAVEVKGSKEGPGRRPQAELIAAAPRAEAGDRPLPSPGGEGASSSPSSASLRCRQEEGDSGRECLQWRPLSGVSAPAPRPTVLPRRNNGGSSRDPSGARGRSWRAADHVGAASSPYSKKPRVAFY